MGGSVGSFLIVWGCLFVCVFLLSQMSYFRISSLARIRRVSTTGKQQY